MKIKFLHVIEIEHFSYPCVNLWIYYACIKSDLAIGPEHRHMHTIKPKGLGVGLGFQFFEYLGFGFGFGYFANLLQI